VLIRAELAMQKPRGEHLQSFYDDIGRVAEMMLSGRMVDNDNEPSEFDCYRSLADLKLMIFVARDGVPPFRFKAGGWEFLQSVAELQPAMEIRVAEKGFLMFRASEDEPGWIEQTDIQVHKLDDD
jgi:hypothetical protein